jgi:hypothetical protein
MPHARYSEPIKSAGNFKCFVGGVVTCSDQTGMLGGLVYALPAYERLPRRDAVDTVMAKVCCCRTII